MPFRTFFYIFRAVTNCTGLYGYSIKATVYTEHHISDFP